MTKCLRLDSNQVLQSIFSKSIIVFLYFVASLRKVVSELEKVENKNCDLEPWKD